MDKKLKKTRNESQKNKTKLSKKDRKESIVVNSNKLRKLNSTVLNKRKEKESLMAFSNNYFTTGNSKFYFI